MKQQDMYTLDELFDNLNISLAKLSKIAGVNETTLSRIQHGYSARRETLNKLLNAFSEVYGIELSHSNVTGTILEDKRETRRIMLARKGITEKPEKPPVSIPAQSAKVETEKPSKRVYNRKQDHSLPSGCVSATEFAASHGVKRETFRDHMTKGLGAEKDRVDYSERDKPSRPKEKEKYLTVDQQEQALGFWEHHKVKFTLCEDEGCICHELFKTK